jgi:hypothetical protein
MSIDLTSLLAFIQQIMPFLQMLFGLFAKS